MLKQPKIISDLEAVTRRFGGELDKNTLLVMGEKHGDYYFHVPTVEALCKAALFVVTERFNDDGNWYGDGSEDEKPEPTGLSKEQFDALPQGRIKEAALEAQKQYEEELRDYEESTRDYRLAKRAVTEKNGAIAMLLLARRQDYEYEGFDFRELTELK